MNNNQPNSLSANNVIQNQSVFAPHIAELSDINIGTSIRNYLSILWKWKWVILGIMFAAATLAFFWAQRVTPLYRATATIEVKQQETNVLGGQVFEETNANDEFLVTQLALLTSSTLAETVVEDLGLQDDPGYGGSGGTREQRVAKAAQVFRNKVLVKRVRGSRIISIAIEDKSPTFSAKVANQLAENFVKFNQERKYNATAYARDFVRERLDVTKLALERSERELYEYIQEAGILSDLDGATNGNNGDLDAEALRILSIDLVGAQSKRIEYENIFNLAKNNSFVSDIEVDSTLDQMVAMKGTLEIEYQEKLLQLKPKHPEMMALQAKINSVNERVENRQNLSRDTILATIKNQYENALTLERQFEERVAQLKRKMISNQSADFNLTILQREVQTNRAQYDALLQRFKEITVSDGTGADLISIVDEAVVPKVPFSPNVPLIIAIAGLLSIFASSVFVILANALDDMVKSPDDVKSKLNVMALGTIPFVKDFKDSMVVELRDPLSSVSEGYGSVRTALGMLIDTSQPLVLQVTSTRAAEGKSSSAYAISKSFAEAGRNVLLIDADMRKPGIKPNLTEKPSIGLSGLLTTPSDLMAQVVKTAVNKINAADEDKIDPSLRDVTFSVLISGKIPLNPVALLSNLRFKQILEEAKSKFDVVIVDSPPVLGLADAIIIGAEVDGTIVMVESNAMRTPPVLQTLKRLRSGGANVLGVVLSKYKRSTDRYSDDYYYYSYSTQGYGENESKKKSNARTLGLKPKPTKKKIKLDIL